MIYYMKYYIKGFQDNGDLLFTEVASVKLDGDMYPVIDKYITYRKRLTIEMELFSYDKGSMDKVVEALSKVYTLHVCDKDSGNKIVCYLKYTYHIENIPILESNYRTTNFHKLKLKLEIHGNSCIVKLRRKVREWEVDNVI